MLARIVNSLLGPAPFRPARSASHKTPSCIGSLRTVSTAVLLP